MGNTHPIRLYLVRHGRAANGWSMSLDPGLDDIGRAQARSAAQAIAALGPMPVVTSPMRRARETAAAFESLWGTRARVEPGVGEIPSPGEDPVVRGPWLRTRMAMNWTEIEDEALGGTTLGAWRRHVIDTLLRMPRSSLVATHFIAINVAVGAATDDDRVTVFRPDNGSCTVVDVDRAGGRLHVVDLGREAETEVQ